MNTDIQIQYYYVSIRTQQTSIYHWKWRGVGLSDICVSKIFDISHTEKDISYIIQNAVYCNARFVADIIV